MAQELPLALMSVWMLMLLSVQLLPLAQEFP
jgi:hypothetical protein